MGNSARNTGFTLIELIVVISLLSIMLFLTIPRFQSDLLSNSSHKFSRWILLNVSALKEKSSYEQKTYFLHINFDSNRLWTTHETMTPEALQDAETNGYNVSEDIKILDVEYPDEGKVSTGQTDIYFYGKGYSDKAIIHIENDDNERLSFLIEPFLPRVRVYNRYVEFEE